MAKEFIQIENEIINVESIDYVNRKTGQKSQEDETPVYILTIVLKSGVQVSIPFTDENASNYVHTQVRNRLCAVQIKIPTLKKK